MDSCTETVKQIFSLYGNDYRSVKNSVKFVPENHEGSLRIIYRYNEEDTVDEDRDSSIVYSSTKSRDVLPFKYLSIEEFKKKLPKMTEKDYLYAQQKQYNHLRLTKQ
ncbi:hypothetical protein PR048_016484 [Dryococelus australis]|uniref:Uncharacterized protein n=1 Tax=Dryococelus australis TaxID=614101 RepID=A0ABQ9HJW7_9NEOP|nr:hypothetical protein PR048_016484 [Dryococelus australis]